MSDVTTLYIPPSGNNYDIIDRLRGALFNSDLDIYTTLREVLWEEAQLEATHRASNLATQARLNESDHNADYADLHNDRHQAAMELERSKSYAKALKKA